jgi:hypothetical protein
MALLRPRQFGTNSQNSYSLPSQDTPPSTMSLPLSGLPAGVPFATTLSSYPNEFGTAVPTTLRVTPSSTQNQSSGSLPTNTPLVSTTSSAYDASATLPASTVGGIGASASSSAPLSASTSPPGIISNAEAKCTSLSCNPGKAAAVFVPIAIVSALLALCIAFFCVRKKGRARLGQGLAFFSHGAETNYVSASASSAGNSRAPSMRETGSSSGLGAGAADLGPAGAAGLAAARGNLQNRDPDFGLGFVPDVLSRSSSCAAPPPYAPRQSNELDCEAVEPADITGRSPLTVPRAPATPTAAHTRTASDPFADTLNPFADENASLLSGDTALNRENGSRRSARYSASIVSSLADIDETGSIREAHVANVSRGPSLSGGRTRPGQSS